MEYNGYHAQIEYDAEDELFIGKVNGITDSLNCHGTPVLKPGKMFNQSIDNYIPMRSETGKTRDNELKVTLS